MLYSDVATELEQQIPSTNQPCILDGEIIVVDMKAIPYLGAVPSGGMIPVIIVP